MKNGQCSASFLLLAVVSMMMFTGCKKVETVSEELDTIDIKVSDNKIPYSDFINSIDTVSIVNEGELYFSSVEDICVGDTTLFLLDETGNLLKINPTTGLIEKKIHLNGPSNSECVNPKAISASEGRVFVLDMDGQKILTLDEDLGYIESMRLPVSSTDFAVTSRGFLLFNLNCGEGDDLVLSIDRNGHIANKYIPNNGLPEMMVSTKIFSESSGGVLIIPPMQNKLYRYDDKTDRMEFLYKYDIDTDGGQAVSAFETDSYLITEYFTVQMMATCVYDRLTGKSTSGLVKTGIPYPFSPIVMKDGSLYGVYNKYPISGDAEGHMIVRYKMK